MQSTSYGKPANSRRSAIDPEVADLLGDMQRQASDRRLPARERQAKSKAQAKAAARLARRVNWDLDESVKRQVIELAERHSVPASQLANLLLYHALADMLCGAILLEDYRRPSKSPKHQWNLVIEENQKNTV